MSLFSLHSDRYGWLAADQRVYAREDIPALRSAVEAAQALSAALDGAQEREAEAIRSACVAAEHEGRAAGFAQGMAEARECLANTLAAVNALGEAAHQRDHRHALELALGIVRKIAGDIAPTEWLEATAERALEQLERPSGVRLLVAPDAPSDLSHRTTLPAGVDAIAIDPCLPTHAVVLETAAGRVQIDLETQLDEIRRWAGTDGLA